MDRIARLETELRSCRDPAARTELNAELAAYLARVGDFDRARRIVADLRAANPDATDARSAIWVILIEGLILYFESLSPAAFDRVYRAYRLSEFAQVQGLRGICAAWMADFEFDRSAYLSMVQLVERALTDRPLLPECQIRAGLVMGDAWLFAGSWLRSRPWYELTRRRSVELGDRAALGAIMYNRASLAVAYLRVHSLSARRAEPPDGGLCIAVSEAESAWSYQTGTHATALGILTQITRGRAALLRGDHREALNLLSLVDQSADAELSQAKRLLVRCEMAHCQFALGQHDQARAAIVNDLLGADPAQFDVDDRCVVLGSAVELASALGVAIPPALVRARDDAEQAYAADMSALSQALEGVSVDPATL